MFNCSVKGLEREERRGDRGIEGGKREEGEKKRQRKQDPQSCFAGDLSSNTPQQRQENAVWMKEAQKVSRGTVVSSGALGVGSCLAYPSNNRHLVPSFSGTISC